MYLSMEFSCNCNCNVTVAIAIVMLSFYKSLSAAINQYIGLKAQGLFRAH